MARVLALILAASIILGVVGCGSKDPEPVPVGDTATNSSGDAAKKGGPATPSLD